MDGWDAEGFLELVESEQVTTTFLTPAHMIRLLELPEDVWRRHDVTSLRHVIHAGAPCPVDVKRRFIEAVPSRRGVGALRRQRGRRHPGVLGRVARSGRARSGCHGRASSCASSTRSAASPSPPARTAWCG